MAFQTLTQFKASGGKTAPAASPSVSKFQTLTQLKAKVTPVPTATPSATPSVPPTITQIKTQPVVNPDQTIQGSKGLLGNLFPNTYEQLQAPSPKSVDWKKAGLDAVDTIKNAFTDEWSRMQDYVKPNQTLPEKISSRTKVVTGAANIVFSPISAIFAGANNIPVLSQLSKVITLPFSVAGEGATKISDTVIDKLPLDQQTKDIIKPGVGEIFALAAQLAVGKAMGGEKVKQLEKKYGKADTATIISKAQELAKEAPKPKGGVEPITSEIPTTGKPLKVNAVRATDSANKGGLFWSDEYIPAYGSEKVTKQFNFKNPIVFEDQFDAVQNLFGKDVRDNMSKDFQKLGVSSTDPRYALNNPKITSFFAKYDKKILSEAKKKGHDGLIYTRGESSPKEIVDLKAFNPNKEIKYKPNAISKRVVENTKKLNDKWSYDPDENTWWMEDRFAVGKDPENPKQGFTVWDEQKQKIVKTGFEDVTDAQLYAQKLGTPVKAPSIPTKGKVAKAGIGDVNYLTKNVKELGKGDVLGSEMVGSKALGTAKPGSDTDVLVTIKDNSKIGQEINKGGTFSFRQVVDEKTNTDYYLTPESKVVEAKQKLLGQQPLGESPQITANPENIGRGVVPEAQKGTQPIVGEGGGVGAVKPAEIKTSVGEGGVGKTVEVPRSQLPVGTEERGVSRLEARMKGVLEKASQEDIDKLGLSTYGKMKEDTQIKMASDYVTKNPEKALQVLSGEIEAPKGVLKNSIYVAMDNLAKGDVELATKLASLSSTRYGQELDILKRLDPDSPVKLMTDVMDIREKEFQKRTGKSPTTARDEVVKSVSEEVKKSKTKVDDWKKFVAEIECGGL